MWIHTFAINCIHDVGEKVTYIISQAKTKWTKNHLRKFGPDQLTNKGVSASAILKDAAKDIWAFAYQRAENSSVMIQFKCLLNDGLVEFMVFRLARFR